MNVNTPTFTIKKAAPFFENSFYQNQDLRTIQIKLLWKRWQFEKQDYIIVQ